MSGGAGGHCHQTGLQGSCSLCHSQEGEELGGHPSHGDLKVSPRVTAVLGVPQFPLPPLHVLLDAHKASNWTLQHGPGHSHSCLQVP